MGPAESALAFAIALAINSTSGMIPPARSSKRSSRDVKDDRPAMRSPWRENSGKSSRFCRGAKGAMNHTFSGCLLARAHLQSLQEQLAAHPLGSMQNAGKRACASALTTCAITRSPTRPRHRRTKHSICRATLFRAN